MEHDDDIDVPAADAPASASGMNRRHLIGLGAAAGAAAWVAPTILSADVAAAQSAPPAPCDCGQFGPPILLTVALGPCVNGPVTVTVTGTQSPPQQQTIPSSGGPGQATFSGFCDGETISVSLNGAPCNPNGDTTFQVSCRSVFNFLSFTCQNCS